MWREGEGIIPGAAGGLPLEMAADDDAQSPSATRDAAAEQQVLAAHTFLLAGAVSADSLMPGRGEFRLERLRTSAVTVASSTQDSVLRDAFWVGEAMPALRSGAGAKARTLPALPRGAFAQARDHARGARDATKTAATAIGFAGPTPETLAAVSARAERWQPGDPPCAALRTVDVTGSVRSHRVNNWLGSAEVSLRIAAQIVGGALPAAPAQGALRRARMFSADSICSPRLVAEMEGGDGEGDAGGGVEPAETETALRDEDGDGS